MQFRTLLLVLPLALAAGDLARAQDPAWNRRVNTISKIEDGAGGATLYASIQTQMFVPQTFAADLSMDVEFLLNGTPIGLVKLAQVVEPLGSGCFGTCHGSCGFGTWGLMGCAIHVPTGTQCVCAGSTFAALPLDASLLVPGDEIMVILYPALGALPEADLDDDRLVLSNIGASGDVGVFDRRILGVEVVPSAAAGDSFFDVWVEVEAVNGATTFADLAFQAQATTSDTAGTWQTEMVSLSLSGGASSGPLSLVIPSVPCEPGEVLTVELVPAPGALPELPGFDEDEESAKVASLFADVEELSVHAGGVQKYTLAAGAAHGGELYLLAGSMSGTAPGLPLGAHVLPLNPDAYLTFSLNKANQPPYDATFGLLDAAGGAGASFTLPVGLGPAFVGLTLHHAYGTAHPLLGTVSGASNAVPLHLLP